MPFLPVDPWTEGKNVYPWAIERDEIETHLAAHPEDRPSILGLHTVVRRSSPAALKRDLATIRAHPELALLHPGLVPVLEARAARPTRHALYAVPFSVAWPDPLIQASGLLAEAAVAIEAERRDLATFLRLRAIDLLSDDNEAGDAAWIRGDLGRLDAVIGAYETYDDDLFGAKAFFGLTLFLRDEAATTALRRAIGDLQEIEASLPYRSHRRVRTDIPAASYDVLAAFGQGQSTAAEILPNDPDLMRKYGRKILVRRNLYTSPESLARARARWEAALERDFHGDLSPEGRYQQVVWHEIGHYLGPEIDREGRSIEDQLEDDAAPVEELKAELISQYAAHRLQDLGHLSAEDVRGIAAGGILASLRPVRPIRSQPYPTLWLMEFNFFLDRGLLIYEDGKVGVRWERHDETEGAPRRGPCHPGVGFEAGGREPHRAVVRLGRAARGPRDLDSRLREIPLFPPALRAARRRGGVLESVDDHLAGRGSGEEHPHWASRRLVLLQVAGREPGRVLERPDLEAHVRPVREPQHEVVDVGQAGRVDRDDDTIDGRRGRGHASTCRSGRPDRDRDRDADRDHHDDTEGQAPKRPHPAVAPVLPGAYSGVPSAQRGHVAAPASYVGRSSDQRALRE